MVPRLPNGIDSCRSRCGLHWNGLTGYAGRLSEPNVVESTVFVMVSGGREREDGLCLTKVRELRAPLDLAHFVMYVTATIPQVWNLYWLRFLSTDTIAVEMASEIGQLPYHRVHSSSALRWVLGQTRKYEFLLVIFQGKFCLSFRSP